MSKRREVEGRIASLNEIHTIMESMKNLSMMEIRKLARYHAAQQRVVDSIRLAFNSVRRHYAADLLTEEGPPVFLLLGSERGFCGAYNEQLIEVLKQQPGFQQAPVIGIGTKLQAALQQVHADAICLPGAAVADEVTAALTRAAASLNHLRRQRGPLRVEVIYFDPDSHQPRCLSALPEREKVSMAEPEPLINLPPMQLLGELLEHYLFALTNAWFFAALVAENQRRIQHLEQAGHHLERQIDELGKRRHSLRQEEILEEIEVILLSAESVSAPGMTVQANVRR